MKKERVEQFVLALTSTVQHACENSASGMMTRAEWVRLATAGIEVDVHGRRERDALTEAEAQWCYTLACAATIQWAKGQKVTDRTAALRAAAQRARTSGVLNCDFVELIINNPELVLPLEGKQVAIGKVLREEAIDALVYANLLESQKGVSNG